MAMIHRDDFNYAVHPTNPGAEAIFQSHGWTSVKTVQDDARPTPPEQGRLYTVTSIPDLSLAWPNGHASALFIDCFNMGHQGDLYLNYGVYAGIGTPVDNFIPGDVWFQMWWLTPHTATQPSLVSPRNKCIYPTRDTFPSNSQRWLFELGNFTHNPFWDSPFGDPSDGEQFAFSRDHSADNLPDFTDSPDYPDNKDKLGQFRDDVYVRPNVWNLIKIHYNTSGVGPNTFEVWIRQYGSNFTKVCEWIHGVTPSFTWVNAPGTDGGHVAFNFPQSLPGNAIGAGPSPGQGHYVQDLECAEFESDLTVYADAPSAATGSGHPLMLIGVL